MSVLHSVAAPLGFLPPARHVCSAGSAGGLGRNAAAPGVLPSCRRKKESESDDQVLNEPLERTMVPCQSGDGLLQICNSGRPTAAGVPPGFAIPGGLVAAPLGCSSRRVVAMLTCHCVASVVRSVELAANASRLVLLVLEASSATASFDAGIASPAGANSATMKSSSSPDRIPALPRPEYPPHTGIIILLVGGSRIPCSLPKQSVRTGHMGDGSYLRHG